MVDLRGMARKRKTSVPHIAAPSIPTLQDRPATQVVEVVEEAPSADDPIETIKKDAQEIEDAVERLEETGPQFQEEEPVLPDSRETDTLEDDHKEVVEELFAKDSSQVPSEITASGNGKRGGKSLLVWAIVVLGIAGLVGAGLIFALTGGAGKSATEPTPTPTIALTPTPQVTVNRADITIEVVNGGGVAGAAGKMKTLLTEKGYTVARVGNADSYAYEETEILVKSGKEAYRLLLKEDIQGDYIVGTSAATLDEDSEYDARVIVGKE